jgi:hypothetical protein
MYTQTKILPIKLYVLYLTTGHAGGIRCYLDAEDDANFLRAFIRPFSKMARAFLEEKGLEVEGTAGLAME